MPTGVSEFYDPVTEDFAERTNLAIPVQEQQPIPRSQVDPFIAQIARLQRGGLLTRRFADVAIVEQLRRSNFASTGIVPRGTIFEPGQTGVSEDDLRAISSISRHRLRTHGSTSDFIPREHTETSGFLRLLELFAAFNFAVAGGIDALVNLAQGETEETNPLLEMWKGFTLQDKQTFSDVLENIGWEGEDGLAYWTRAVTGFALDVVLDPINFVTFGAASAAAKAGGVIAATRRLRAGKVLFETGERIRPTAILDEVAGKLAKEAKVAAESGILERSSIMDTASEARARALARLYAEKRAEIAIELGPRRAIIPQKGAAARELLDHEIEFLVQGKFSQDVYQVFERIAAERNPHALEKLKARAKGGPDGFHSWVTLMGAGNRDADVHMATEVLSTLLAKEKKVLSADNVIEYLASGSDRGISRLFDPGGLKVSIPFTDIEKSIVKAQWMDALKFRLSEAASEYFGDAARWLTSSARPRAVQATTKGIAAVWEFTREKVAVGAENVKLAFGATGERSAYLQSILKRRQAALTTAAPQSAEMTQEILTKSDGTALGKKSAAENEVLFDALVAEEEEALREATSGRKFFAAEKMKDEIDRLDAIGDPRGAELREKYGTRLGYEEKHLERIIMSDKRLEGYSKAEREEILGIARKIDQHFRRVHDELTAEGLQVGFYDFYLPAQYENVKEVFKAEFKSRRLARHMTDTDPFIRLRKLTREEASRPVSQGGLGLRPVRNVYGLVFGRFMAAERARIERLFVSRLMDNFAIHPGQVERLFGAMYGTNGRLGAGILDSIRQKTMPRDVWGESNLLSAIPKLEELKNLIETGRMPEALEWIENNPDTINAAILEKGTDPLVPGQQALLRSFTQSIQRGQAVLHEKMNQLGTHAIALSETIRQAIGKTPDEVLTAIREAAGSAEEGDLIFAAAFGKELEAAVLSRMEAQSTRAIELLESAAPGRNPGWVRASELSGEAAARFTVLDEALHSVETGSAQELIRKKYKGTIDEVADHIVGMIRGSSSEESVQWLGMDAQVASMLARTLPARAIEEAIDLGGATLSHEVVSGALYHKIDVYRRLMAEGKVDAANELLADAWEGIAKNPFLAAHAVEWRRARGLPEIPLGEYTMEARAKIFEMIDDARVTGRKHKLKFFGESPYLPSAAEKRELRDKVKGMVEKTLSRYAGKDRQLFSTLMDLVNRPGSFRSGLHWEPFQGLQGLIETSAAARASTVMGKVRETALDTLPKAVIDHARKHKLTFDWITRNLMESPRVVLEGEMKSLKAMTATLRSALEVAAKRAGVPVERAGEIVGELTKRIEASLEGRGFEKVSMTEAHVALKEAVDSFGTELRELFGDSELGEHLHSITNEFGHELRQVNQNIAELTNQADQARETYSATVASLRAILDHDRPGALKLIDEMEGLGERVRELVASVEDRAEGLVNMQDDLPIGRELATKFMKDDPVVGSFFRIVDDLRKDLAKMPKAVEAEFRANRLKLARAQEKRAVAAIEALQQKLDNLVRPMHALQEQARVLELMQTKVEGQVLTTGAGRELFAQWLELAAMEEFLSGGSRGADAWRGAVEKVWMKGPQSPDLRPVWDALVAHRENPAILEEVRRLSQSLVTEPVNAELWRAQRRVTAGRPIASRVELQDLRVAVQEALGEQPALMQVLGLDEGFWNEVGTRAAAKVAGEPDTLSDWVTRFADEVFLPPEEAKSIAKEMREKQAWIDSFFALAQERIGILSRLGARGPMKATQDLRAALIAMKPKPRSVVAFSRMADEAAEEAANLVEQFITTGEIPPELARAGGSRAADEIEGLLKEDEAIWSESLDLATASESTITPESYNLRTGDIDAALAGAETDLDQAMMDIDAVRELLDEHLSASDRGFAVNPITNERIPLSPGELAEWDQAGMSLRRELEQAERMRRLLARRVEVMEQIKKLRSDVEAKPGLLQLVQKAAKEIQAGGIEREIGQALAKIEERIDAVYEKATPALGPKPVAFKLPKVPGPNATKEELVAAGRWNNNIPEYTNFEMHRQGLNPNRALNVMDVTGNRAHTREILAKDPIAGFLQRNDPESYERFIRGDLSHEEYELALKAMKAAAPSDADQLLAEVAKLSSQNDLVRLTNGDFTPEEVAAFDEFRRTLKGGPPTSKQAAYWIWRMGLREGPTATGLQIPGAASVISKSIRRYQGRNPLPGLVAGRIAEVQGNLKNLVRGHEGLVEARALAQEELELFRGLVIPDIEQGKNLNLSYGPDEILEWRTVRQYRNYLRMQVLRAEHLGLAQVAAAMPSRSELRFLRTLAKLDELTPEDLDRVSKMALGERALREEDRDAVDALSAITWEGTQEQWETLLSRNGQYIRNRLGITQEALDGGQQELLKSLLEAGVEGIEVAENGKLTFRQGALRLPGEAISTVEHVRLNDAVAEILEMQGLVEGGIDVAGAPALESQVRMIGRHLGHLSEDPAEQAMALYALTGRTRADHLSSMEAAHVIDYMGRHRSSEILQTGRRAVRMSAEDLFLGRRARGHMPFSTMLEPDLGESILLHAERDVGVPAEDIGTPYSLETLHFPRMENAVSLSGKPLDEVMHVEKWVADLINQNVLQDRAITGVMASMLANGFDPLTNSFKWLQTAPFPSFHLRNALDVTIRAFFAIGLKALNMRRNFELYQVLSRKGSITIRGQKYEAGFLLDLFERMGGKTDFHEMLGISKVDIAGVTDPRLSPWNENFVLRGVRTAGDALNNVAGKIDNVSRMALLIDGIERGLSPIEAMRFAQKFIFDYAYGLTPFEREVMRRVFPFYTFSRFNIPLMLEMAYQRPGLIALMGKTHNLMSDNTNEELETLLPSYVRNAWRLRPEIRGNELRVLSGTQVIAIEDLDFIGDLTRWRDRGMEGVFQEILGRLNPMLKLAPELYLRKNLYFGSTIRENEDLRKAVLDVPVIHQFLQMRKVVAPDGTTLWRVNGRRWHALQQTHIARLYRTLAQTIGESDMAAWERMLPFVTGLRVVKVDLKRRLEHLEAVSTFNQARIERALEQGDWVSIKRALDLSQRDDDRQDKVDAAYLELSDMVKAAGGR